MPSLSIDLLKNLQDDYTKYKVFIETGTFMGFSIFNVEPYFDKLYTIEIAPHYYHSTKSKYNGNKIDFILGDSSKELIKLVSNINDKVIFWLDGHYSSMNTGKGDKDVPLLEELTTINNLFKHEAIIIIDDYRLFGTNVTEDWTEITKVNVLNRISSRITNVYHLPSELAHNDRLVIHIKSL